MEPLSLERQQFSSTKLISVSIISAFGLVFAGGLILQYFKYSLLTSSVKLISAEYSLQFFCKRVSNRARISGYRIAGLYGKKLVAYVVICKPMYFSPYSSNRRVSINLACELFIANCFTRLQVSFK